VRLAANMDRATLLDMLPKLAASIVAPESQKRLAFEANGDLDVMMRIVDEVEKSTFTANGIDGDVGLATLKQVGKLYAEDQEVMTAILGLADREEQVMTLMQMRHFQKTQGMGKMPTMGMGMGGAPKPTGMSMTMPTKAPADDSDDMPGLMSMPADQPAHVHGPGCNHDHGHGAKPMQQQQHVHGPGCNHSHGGHDDHSHGGHDHSHGHDHDHDHDHGHSSQGGHVHGPGCNHGPARQMDHNTMMPLLQQAMAQLPFAMQQQAMQIQQQVASSGLQSLSAEQQQQMMAIQSTVQPIVMRLMQQLQQQ